MVRNYLQTSVALISLIGAGWLSAFAFAQTDSDLARQTDCSQLELARTLSPERQAKEASAAWLDATQIWVPKRERVASTAIVSSPTAMLEQQVSGEISGVSQRAQLNLVDSPVIPAELRWRGEGAVWRLDHKDRSKLSGMLTEQVWLVQSDEDGKIVFASRVQHAAALDALYFQASLSDSLGLSYGPMETTWRVWVPTAQHVSVCVGKRAVPMHVDTHTGIATATVRQVPLGTPYRYLVDVYAPGVGVVRNSVTDPYSVALTPNSTQSVVMDLNASALQPAGWSAVLAKSAEVKKEFASTDLAIYELHVRDFSVTDRSVREAWRGKYLAFTEDSSDGMQHLARLARAGLTDIHLLPVFDFATVPEKGCIATLNPLWDDDSAPEPRDEALQAEIARVADRDCYNWGYDPLHFNVPEGSYAVDVDNAAARIYEFRSMVMGLKRLGLRVGMDVVYNHMSAAGQSPKSILDRLVPGYYHRLNSRGEIERSTCCDNTATEHRMMAKLMIDSAVFWVKHYGIDSFRFDLMGHQPREAMERLQREVNRAAGRHIHLLGEGWNFGEVENGQRFVQASQLSLKGSGIATFNDRLRDAVRGGAYNDAGTALLTRKGFIHRDGRTDEGAKGDRLDNANLVRAGIAASVSEFILDGRPLAHVNYRGAPAGYTSSPLEVVNYIENHDNQTLFDINAFRLPSDTSAMERARVQVLAIALTALAQGVPYFHGGVDLLRSKSLDGNSYDSGDAFNAIDWSQRYHGWSTHLPRKADNGHNWEVMRPLLAQRSLSMPQAAVGFTHQAFLDWLTVRASSPLFRLREADEVMKRLRFIDADPLINDRVVAFFLDGRDLQLNPFAGALVVINPTTVSQMLTVPEFIPTAQLAQFRLHPAIRDGRARENAYVDVNRRMLNVPARTAVVWVRSNVASD